MANAMVVPGLLQLAPGFLGTKTVLHLLYGQSTDQSGAFFEVFVVALQLVIGLLVAALLFRRSEQASLDLRNGKPVLIKLPEVSSIDDGPGKPINIHLHIGQRPISAFGNSDGDLQMLQYTDAGPGIQLIMLLHHDDARREYAYDRDSRRGRLDEALDAAASQGWTVVSVRADWNRVFPSL